MKGVRGGGGTFSTGLSTVLTLMYDEQKTNAKIPNCSIGEVEWLSDRMKTKIATRLTPTPPPPKRSLQPHDAMGALRSQNGDHLQENVVIFRSF